MIKAYKKFPTGERHVLLGISDENERRLVDGKPIKLNLKGISPDLPNIEIFIIRGDTEATMAAELGENKMPTGWIVE